MRPSLVYVPLVFVLLLAGCFSPRYHDGNLQCGPQGECPDGYHCAPANNTCWSNGHDPEVDAGPPVPLDQLAAEYARVVCEKDFACCSQSDLKGKNLATCEKDLAGVFQRLVQAISEGVDRGRTTYVPENATQCLQAIRDIDCNSWPVQTPEDWIPQICQDTIAGQVGAGGACRSGVECATGFCNGASSNADGTCLRKAESGQTCIAVVVQNSCSSGLYCDSTNTCAETMSEGESCAQNRDCKSQICGAFADAGSVCLAPTCYSNGPLVSPACAFGGRPSVFAAGLVLACLVLSVRRRTRRSSR